MHTDTQSPVSPALLRLYRECRIRKPFMLVGHDARCSLNAARTILRFRELESAGRVRMRAEPEAESYFSVYGEPEGYVNAQGHEVSAETEREEMCAILDRDGVWCSISEWFDGEDWQLADSCGMHTGYKNPLDPFENCYVVQEMQEAIDAVDAHDAAQAKESAERAEWEARDTVTA